MATRQRVSTGSPYEPVIGISRAIKAGRFISISGTAPLDSGGKTVGAGDPAAQTRRCIQIAQTALKELGADLSDVIRTRVMLTDIEDWRKVGEVHGEFFSEIRPASTMVQVTRFVDPAWLVEMEFDAVVEQ
jgi:enamine deaminase RidA (YjgF/YER057c/UK114 family)